MSSETSAQTTVHKIPAYSEFFYGEVYNNLDKSRRCDNQLSTFLHYFGQHDKLVSSLLREVKQSQRVLQMGLAYGNEISRVARRIGAYGDYDIIDVNEHQISQAKLKYEDVPGLNIFYADAAAFEPEKPYDTVICFFLLRELPVVTKMKVVNNALKAVKPGGNVIFIEDHNPVKWHPLRYLVRMYNRLHHPFIEKLWDREIDTFANNKIDFIWRKSTYFGRMYQKVVATRKNGLLETSAPQEPHPFPPF